MAATLPFTPSETTYTRTRPRRTTESPLTRFIQQKVTQNPYWAGELSFSPARDDDEVRGWRAFVVDLERLGTFWAPVFDTSATNTTWRAASLLNPTTLSVAGGSYLPGDLVQVRSTASNDISFLKSVEEYENDELVVGTPIPLINAVSVEVGSGKVHARAVVEDSDYSTLIVDPNKKEFQSLGWIEAMGFLRYEAAALNEEVGA